MLIALIVALATPTPTPSASASPPPVIETVRVATGSPQALHRLPLGTSLLTQSELQFAPQTTSDAVLRVLPGFDRNRSNSNFTNYGQLRVSFAGAGTDRGLVLVDGIPAQDLFGGQIDWAAYPSRELTRAELLRGPGSALYGTGAIGGVLQLSTFAPSIGSPAAGMMHMTAGSLQSVDADALATVNLSTRFAASIVASQQQLSYNDLPPGYQSPIDRAAVSTTSALDFKLRYAADATTSYEYGYRGAWDVQQEGRPNYDFWRNFIEHHITLTHSTTNASLFATAYDRTTFVTNRADQPAAPGTLLYTQYVPTHETGVVAQWTVDSPSTTFALRADARFGGGVSNQFNARNILTVSGSGTQELQDIAAQTTWRFSRGEFVAGLAGSAIDLPNAHLLSAGTTTTVAPRTDRALSPRAAIRYDLTKQLAFRAAAGTGFRAPFLNELVRGYVVGPVSYLPNPTLVPERSSSLTAGLDWVHGTSELAADVVHTYVSDAIEFATVDPTHQVRSNVARTQTDGAIFTYTRRISAVTTATLSATAQNARVITGNPASIGKKLPYVPQASANADFTTRVGATFLGATLSYLGQTFADDANRQPLGTAVTVGLRAELPIARDARIVFAADNLTNARYLSSIDRYGPPARCSLGLELPLGTEATTSP